MKPQGSHLATQDRDEALAILAARIKQLKRSGPEVPRSDTLAAYARYHLSNKANRVRPSTVARYEQSLRIALGFLGPTTRLVNVSVRDLTRFIDWRLAQRGKRDGQRVQANTVLRDLAALSGMFRRAVAEGIVMNNPVAQLQDRPRPRKKEAIWLEPGEVARILAAAKEIDASPHHRAFPHLHPVLATLAYTGGRFGECAGLLIEDVDFARAHIHFRPNRWRELKRDLHRRWVPLWPDLEAVLKPYVGGLGRGTGLLFPAASGGPIKDIRGGLKRALVRAGVDKPVTNHTFRHTYTAARLQTIDRGAPISPYTVQRELGHTSLGLIESTYGHLMAARHRASVVEYREAEVVDLASHRGDQRRPA